MRTPAAAWSVHRQALISATLLSCAMVTSLVCGQDPMSNADVAIERGRAQIASKIGDDGAIRANWGQSDVDLAMTSAALTAFVALDSGVESAAASRMRRWIEARCLDQTTRATSKRPFTHRHYQWPIALRALVATHRAGRSDEMTTRAIATLIDRASKSQQPDGGWRYGEPDPYALVSTTVGWTIALGEARALGFTVADDVIARALAYLAACRLDGGGYRYAIDLSHPLLSRDVRRYGGSTFARELTVLCARRAAGAAEELAPDEARLERGIESFLADVADEDRWFALFWAAPLQDASKPFQRHLTHLIATDLRGRQGPGGSWEWRGKSWAKLLGRDSIVDGFATATALLWLAIAREQDAVATPNAGSAEVPIDTESLTRRTRRALLDVQRSDGSLPRGEPGYADEIWSTALGGLALLSTTPKGERPVDDAVRRAVGWLVERIPYDGPLRTRKPAVRDDAADESWLAAMTTIFLCEVHRIDPDAVGADRIERLVRRLLFLEKPGGGWCHDLAPKHRQTTFGEAIYSDDLVAATNFVTGALALARREGIAVPNAVFRRIASYYESCRNVDGGYAYGRNHIWERAVESERGRTAGAVWALALAGIMAKPSEKTIEYLSADIEHLPASPGHGGHDFLISYLTGALAAQTIGGEFEKRFRDVFTRRIAEKITADGWVILYRSAWEGDVANTATAALVLSLFDGPLRIR